MMKITGGVLHGRKIKVGKNLNVRCTSSLVRSALFSILGEKVRGAFFLDLFCGSGIISMEALSRGARFATLVDLSKRSIRCVSENAKKLNLLGKMEFLNMDFRKAISYLHQMKRKFDIVFVDPPYNKNYCEVVLLDLSDHIEILNEEALIILEHHKKEEFNIPQNFSVQKKRKFGDTIILILKYL